MKKGKQIWREERDKKGARSLASLTSRSHSHLRWSETKNLKISIPDNMFFIHLIIIKLCTLKQLENMHQKLKLEFSERSPWQPFNKKMTKKGLKASCLESLMKKYKWKISDHI